MSSAKKWLEENGFKFQWTMENHEPDWWEKQLSEHVTAKIYDRVIGWECIIDQRAPDGSRKVLGHALKDGPASAWKKAYAQYEKAPLYKKIPMELVNDILYLLEMAVYDDSSADVARRLRAIKEEY